VSRYRREVFKTVTVWGEKINVSIDSSGFFSARAGIDYLRAASLNELLGQLRKAISKTRIKVAVPATLANVDVYDKPGQSWRRKVIARTCKRIIMTGINPKNNEIQYVMEDGTKGEQRRRSYSHDGGFMKPMTDDQIAEWERLIGARDKATSDFDKFVERFKMDDAEKIVRAAIEAKASEAPESEEEETGDPRVDAPKKRGVR
jgi:hypothetical protein